MAQLLELAAAGNSAGAEALVEGREAELNQSLLLTSLTAFLTTSAILATIAARLPSDPHSNRYGPPPAGMGRTSTPY